MAATRNNQTDIKDRGNTNDTEDFKIPGSHSKVAEDSSFPGCQQLNLNVKALRSYETWTTAHSMTK